MFVLLRGSHIVRLALLHTFWWHHNLHNLCLALHWSYMMLREISNPFRSPSVVSSNANVNLPLPVRLFSLTNLAFLFHVICFTNYKLSTRIENKVLNKCPDAQPLTGCSWGGKYSLNKVYVYTSHLQHTLRVLGNNWIFYFLTPFLNTLITILSRTMFLLPVTAGASWPPAISHLQIIWLSSCWFALTVIFFFVFNTICTSHIYLLICLQCLPLYRGCHVYHAMSQSGPDQVSGVRRRDAQHLLPQPPKTQLQRVFMR